METLINPEVPDKHVNHKRLLAEVLLFIEEHPKFGKLLYMILSKKYGVFNP